MPTQSIQDFMGVQRGELATLRSELPRGSFDIISEMAADAPPRRRRGNGAQGELNPPQQVSASCQLRFNRVFLSTLIARLQSEEARPVPAPDSRSAFHAPLLQPGIAQWRSAASTMTLRVVGKVRLATVFAGLSAKEYP